MIGTTDNNSDNDYRIFMTGEEFDALKRGELVCGDLVQVGLDGVVRGGLSLEVDDSVRGNSYAYPVGRSVDDLDSLHVSTYMSVLEAIKERNGIGESRVQFASRKVHFHVVGDREDMVKGSYDSLCHIRDELLGK